MLIARHGLVLPTYGENPCQTRTKQQIMRNFCYSCVIRQKSHCVKRSKGLNEIRNFCLPVTWIKIWVSACITYYSNMEGITKDYYSLSHIHNDKITSIDALIILKQIWSLDIIIVTHCIISSITVFLITSWYNLLSIYSSYPCYYFSSFNFQVADTRNYGDGLCN